ncbi:MAG: TonB-dependent receptor, partial [Bacteroidales bacterium]|nr:TonB-dependent receptor [Bacteroidales bacterium]
YVLNLGLFYAGKEKDNLDISLMYNIIGPRIYIVGQPKSQPWEFIPNIYEMPRHQVDLTLTKKFGDHLELKVGIKDLFNQPVVFEQSIHTDVDLSFYGVSESNTVHFDRRQVFRQYRPGSWYSIGIQYVF